MENKKNKNGFENIKPSNSIKKSNDDINGNSMLSISESNNLIYNEIRNNKQIEYEPKILNEMLQKYFNNNFDKNSHLSLSEILNEREYNFDSELYDIFNYYQTLAFYKEGNYCDNIKKYKECRLLLKENYLYVLNNYNNKRNKISINDINPENSFLLKLEKDKNINEQDKKYIKYDYDLSHPLLCLNFNLLSCILLINRKYSNEFSILILGTNKKYSFIIEDQQKKENFCFLIGNFIYNSDGYKYNKLDLALNRKYFYLNTFITPDDFECMAKTGDIILFKTKHILSNLQRFFTRDNYDHIAFIQSNYGFITIFDASKNGSCKSHYWGSFKASLNNLAFDKICYRRLNIEEKNYEKKMEIQENIENITEQFLIEVMNKKYYLSICNILFKSKPKKYEIDGEWEKADGYSCSSLVAALYIKLGVIKLEKSVHCIKPGDFEQNKNLYFQPGYSLGPEKIIEFSG